MCIVRWQGIIFQYKKNLYTGFMSPITTVLIIQPPLVQLNTAYPAGAYLKAFFFTVEGEEAPVEFRRNSMDSRMQPIVSLNFF